MALTEAQRTTLAADIRANTDQDVIDALAIRNDTELTRLYNLDSTFYCYKSRITVADIGMEFDYAEVANLTSANQERLQTFRSYNQDEVNASRTDIHAFFADVFSGAAGANTRVKLGDDPVGTAWSRFVTVAEEVFASGTGTQAAPGTLGWEGTLTTNDVGRALSDNP